MSPLHPGNLDALHRTQCHLGSLLRQIHPLPGHSQRQSKKLSCVEEILAAYEL